RHDVLLAARSPARRSAALGPRQRQEGARVSGEGAKSQPGAVGSDGERRMNDGRPAMPFEGTVVNGIIVLDQPHALPEGARVEVLVKAESKNSSTLREMLLNSAGCMSGLPVD